MLNIMGTFKRVWGAHLRTASSRVERHSSIDFHPPFGWGLLRRGSTPSHLWLESGNVQWALTGSYMNNYQKTQAGSKRLTVQTWGDIGAKQIRVSMIFLVVDIVGIKWASNDMRLYTREIQYSNPTAFLSSVKSKGVDLHKGVNLHKGVKTL